MKKIRTLVASLSLICIFSYRGIAQANFFAEPYVGLSKLELRQESTGFVSKDIANGFHLGIKAGVFINKKIFIGGEYFHAGPYKYEDLFSNSEISNTLIGAIVGADFDVIRVSASYFFKHDMQESLNSRILLGSAIRLGIGISVVKKIRTNLDVFLHNITEERGTSSSSTPTNISGFSAETVSVSISFPFKF